MTVERIIVPVIDLAKFEEEKEKLMVAVEELGCFRVINHGISEKIMADIKALVEHLLKLPTDVKQRNTDVISKSGYIEPNCLGPLYESLGIYDASSSIDIHTFCSLLDFSSHDREILSTFALKLHDLIVDLAFKVAQGLGIKDCSFQEWSCNLRMNKYNFTKETVIGTCGVIAHSDSSFITILFEDESNEGFEIMGSTGNFLAVDPVPGTFFVNIGDMGKVWSNGRLHNVQHRVLCKKPKSRITIVLFMLAPKDNKIEPQAELIDSEHPKLFESFNYMEYRKNRGSTTSIAGEVLLKWAIDEATKMA
ncbi:2-oxoglutarate-dependent dioxygenase DAO-like [Dendrobium catenatum]|nr:2-oxoglutarate-dependent dioxygenase DAO-like [Dendrobium catenatum]